MSHTNGCLVVVVVGGAVTATMVVDAVENFDVGADVVWPLVRTIRAVERLDVGVAFVDSNVVLS